MNTTITVMPKTVYGVTTYYPACQHAELFASIAGTTTLTIKTLKYIYLLGYTIGLANCPAHEAEAMFAKIKG
jgi:uncharacterized membrane protein